MRKEKEITLIALTITIIILLILASVSTYSGISTVKSSKLNKYKQGLEIMQSQVNLLYEKYSREIEGGQEIEIGEELTNSEEENNAFTGANETDKAGYRLFTKETLEELGIDGIEKEYLVNIAKRQVISLEPFEQDGEVYYTLAQLSKKNIIKEGIDRGEIEFTVGTNVLETGIEINISNIKYSKYVGKGSILYQKVGDSIWKTLVTDYRESTYTFTLSEVGEYHVVNNGTIGYIVNGDSEINSGVINKLYVQHGTCLINGGTIADLSCFEGGPIEITIGNINDEVNNNNPEIQEFNFTGGTYENSTFYFYNGIVKNTDLYGEFINPFDVVRIGYKTQRTTEGLILVKE